MSYYQNPAGGQQFQVIQAGRPPSPSTIQIAPFVSPPSPQPQFVQPQQPWGQPKVVQAAQPASLFPADYPYTIVKMKDMVRPKSKTHPCVVGWLIAFGVLGIVLLIWLSITFAEVMTLKNA